MTTINKLKKEEYFRFPGKKVVYVYAGYNRSERVYEYYEFRDISSFHSRKNKLTIVDTDFEF